MIHYFGSLNSLIMLTMAVDRYLAICFPLRWINSIWGSFISYLRNMEEIKQLSLFPLTQISHVDDDPNHDGPDSVLLGHSTHLS